MPRTAKPKPAASTSPWRKSPQALIDKFTAALPDDPRIEPRKMFGYPCAFVHGNMFTGLHQESLVVRLGEDQRRQAIEKHGGSIFEPMPGRQMREYVVLPAAIISDKAKLSAWIGTSLAYAASLPPKQPEKKTAKKAAPDKPARKKA